jgi:3-oxochol-4-en-24-oyl-CoA dehydrogenase
MSVGITEEQIALAEAVGGWISHHASAGGRGSMSGRPAFWEALAEQGLLGLHLAEDAGGGGGTVVELAVAVEQAGRGLLPGPFLPTVVVSAVLSLAVGDAYLPEVADGTRTAGFATAAGDLRAVRRQGGAVSISGTTGPLLGGEADLFLLAATGERDEVLWFLLDAQAAKVRVVDSLDAGRPLVELTVDDHLLAAGDVLEAVDDDLVAEVAVTLASAEAAGIAGWCLDTAAAHARTREQFGRPIGQFQAVKHRCAEMLVMAEQARAAAWDAARALRDARQRPLAAAVAAVTGLEAAVENAKACIQILGGIGFTWEHDAHRFLRRALTLRQLLGPTSRWRARAAALALGGARRTLDLQLPAEAVGIREEVRRFLGGLEDLAAPEQRRALADAGYIQPHWPEPWGRGAGAVEQLVIDEELAAAGIERPDLVIGGWILPTLIAHGTAEQQQRFIPPTLHGELTWCQMFSEPGAGSDLAALQTRATRVDGGWELTGQKVWTSLAHRSDWGLCLARTDPAAPKHEGITCFLVDMRSAGLDIRPLRELTGRDMFNEVFLDAVRVPDELVVGAVGDGWRVGRTTLANERVAMSSGSTMGAGVEGALAALGAGPAAEDPLLRDRAGRLVCEGQVLALLGFRTTLRRLSGIDPGAASSVRKLVGMQHAQDCAELILELLGPAGATTEGVAGRVTFGFLQSRCLTIAGGTTEVQRNVVAERMLGLPRDDAGSR